MTHGAHSAARFMAFVHNSYIYDLQYQFRPTQVGSAGHRLPGNSCLVFCTLAYYNYGISYCCSTRSLTHSPTHPLTHPPTHPPYSPTHPVTHHPPTHPPIHPLTHSLPVTLLLLREVTKFLQSLSLVNLSLVSQLWPPVLSPPSLLPLFCTTLFSDILSFSYVVDLSSFHST